MRSTIGELHSLWTHLTRIRLDRAVFLDTSGSHRKNYYEQTVNMIPIESGMELLEKGFELMLEIVTIKKLSYIIISKHYKRLGRSF